MQKGAEKISAKEAVIWAISYDSKKTIEKVKRQLQLTIPLLPDPESRLIDLFGVRNPKGKGKKAGVAIPTTFIVSKDGTVKAKLAFENVRERHGPTEIVAELDK